VCRWFFDIGTLAHGCEQDKVVAVRNKTPHYDKMGGGGNKLIAVILTLTEGKGKICKNINCQGLIIFSCENEETEKLQSSWSGIKDPNHGLPETKPKCQTVWLKLSCLMKLHF
jgi:hypothetical protein